MVMNELSARGHDVGVLTSNHAKPGHEFNAHSERIERTLRIHGLYGHPWLNMADLRKLEVHNNQTLRKAISRHRPDLVYVWNMGGLSKSMLFTLQQIGIPTVFYVSDHWIARGFAGDVWIQWWNRTNLGRKAAFARTLLKGIGYKSYLRTHAPTLSPGEAVFKRIHFCSKALRKLTASAGFEVMHGAVIYPPVDITRFEGAPRKRGTPMKQLLWVGRLSEDKGIMTALKAMQRVKDRFSGQLNIFGQGDKDYTRHLKDFARSENLPVAFKSAGMDEMPEVYRAHDALLFTSEWAEPFALTPLEAMASGLPVIGTMTGGSRELFRHGDNSLVYTAGNFEELAERIEQLSKEESTREGIATTGYHEVRENYALPSVVNQIEKYLQQSAETWTEPGPAALTI
jgi:glycosyltransferase involved in cell wall biosynthesis